jgi:hypothetical protein
MTGAALSSTPVTGELSRDGHLLRADDRLTKLHAGAGGTRGGIIACPALFGLVQIVSRLQMRLARALIVSDGTDNFELWVEAEPAGENVRIAILSWRSKTARNPDPSAKLPWASVMDETMTLNFDQALRLIRATGPVGDVIHQEDFGCGARHVVTRLLGDTGDIYLHDMEKFNAIGRSSTSLNTNNNTLLWGEPETNPSGETNGSRYTFPRPLQALPSAIKEHNLSIRRLFLGKISRLF